MHVSTLPNVKAPAPENCPSNVPWITPRLPKRKGSVDEGLVLPLHPKEQPVIWVHGHRAVSIGDVEFRQQRTRAEAPDTPNCVVDRGMGHGAQLCVDPVVHTPALGRG